MLSFDGKEFKIRFGKNKIGTLSFAKGTVAGKEMAALNVRCFDDVNLGDFKVQPYDSKNKL